MADIELVIKISEKAYNALIHTEFDANLVVDEMRKSIAHGTPLPKGHGKAIEYIKTDISRLWDTPQNLEHKEALEMAIKALEQEPKTGHWIDNKARTDLCNCSECGALSKAYSKYCHNCGAKMK